MKTLAPGNVKGLYLVLDVTRPSMDGCELYATARSLREARRMQKICATAYQKHFRVLVVKVMDEFKAVGSYTARRVT